MTVLRTTTSFLLVIKLVDVGEVGKKRKTATNPYIEDIL